MLLNRLIILIFKLITQINLDKALIMNESYLTQNPFYFENIDIMNIDDHYFHYRINAHGIDMKKINLLKKNGYSIKSIYPDCTDKGIGLMAISLKWKIPL